ncbi:exosortase X [uncultured Hymenobacter sp.]|uniref:exosortase X n=1 Tax=uncultured Hymenobacter sp. TaxID=170016 RepID=UPI0035CB22D7
MLPAPTPLSYPSSSAGLVRRFVLVAAALLLVWFFGYEQTLAVDGRFDRLLCGQIAGSGAAALRLLGFSAAAYPPQPQLLYLGGRAAVHVGPACNGLVLYCLFAGFVIAYPGPAARKLWYIPVGVGLIYLLNVLRVAGLALNQHYAPGTLDFNHHYTFSFVVYAAIFGLWMLWARRLAGPLAPAATQPAGVGRA